MSNGNPTISAGQVPRQPTYWDDLTLVTKVLQPDGTYAPGAVAVLYASNGLPWPGVTMLSAAFSTAVSGNIIAGTILQAIRVYSIKLICSGDAVVNWADPGFGALEGAQSIVSGGGYIEAVDPPAFLFQTSPGQGLDITISGGGTAAGRVSYWKEIPA